MNTMEKIWDRIKQKQKLFIFFSIATVVLIAYEKHFAHFPKKMGLLLWCLVAFILFFIGKKRHVNVFIIAAGFGVFFSLASPIFEIWDEPAHYTRAEYIAEGNLGLSADPDTHVVSQDIKTLEEVSRYMSRKKAILPNFFHVKLWQYQHDETKSYEERVPGTNAYSFLSYLPSSLGLIIGKLVSNGNLGVMFYLGRIVNSLFYALCAMLAVKIAKKWGNMLTFFVLQPMVIYISASFNQDAFSYGLILIVIAYFCRLMQCKEQEIHWKQVMLYAGLCGVLSITKLPYIALAGLLIFIPQKKYASKKTFLLGIVGIVGVIASAMLWMLIYSKIPGNIPEGNVNMSLQVQYILTHIKETIQLFLTSFVETINKYTQFAAFAWDNQKANELAIINFLFFGFLLIYPEPEFKTIPRCTKLGLAAVSLCIASLIYLSMYLTWTEVGATSIAGVQGRYFLGVIALFPLFMNFSKFFGDTTPNKYSKDLLLYMPLFLLIWTAAVRIGVYF